MAEFGGLGGVSGGRALNSADDFEMSVAALLGGRMKRDDALCAEVWSSLANGEWYRANGDTASYSFRAAGDLIAAVIGRGDYIDWYCSGPYATCSERVALALAPRGWAWRELKEL